MRLLSLLTILLLCSSTFAQDTTYRVEQCVTLGPLEAGSKGHIDWWISIPDDAPHQAVLDFAVTSTPGPWQVVRGSECGRFLLIQIDATEATSLEARVEFTVRRDVVEMAIDPDRVGKIDDTNRELFRSELDPSAPHMAVTPEIRAMADRTCGDETNLARQARLLLDHVAAVADHYSKDRSKPSCGVGDAGSCVLNGGGCCTDLHSLFIALARARGIPARLEMGYRLLGRNEGKWIDPGYRCWVEYFLPGCGWVSADIVEADATGGLGKAVWFSGLTEERVWLNQGRNFTLPGDPTPQPVNHMSIGHAEIDGVPVRVLPEGDLPSQLKRQVKFERVASE